MRSGRCWSRAMTLAAGARQAGRQAGQHRRPQASISHCFTSGPAAPLSVPCTRSRTHAERAGCRTGHAACRRAHVRLLPVANSTGEPACAAFEVCAAGLPAAPACLAAGQATAEGVCGCRVRLLGRRNAETASKLTRVLQLEQELQGVREQAAVSRTSLLPPCISTPEALPSPNPCACRLRRVDGAQLSAGLRPVHGMQPPATPRR